MVDMKKYYSDIDSKKLSPTKPTIPSLRSEKTWVTDCTCVVCRRRKEEEARSTRSMEIFADFYRIFPEHAELRPHKLFLLPHKLWAFVFKTRTWGKNQWLGGGGIAYRNNRTTSRKGFRGTHISAGYDRQTRYGCQPHQNIESTSRQLYPSEYSWRENGGCSLERRFYPGERPGSDHSTSWQTWRW
jgi:hypothetical protein